jgi:hypothetical protein
MKNGSASLSRVDERLVEMHDNDRGGRASRVDPAEALRAH